MIADRQRWPHGWALAFVTAALATSVSLLSDHDFSGIRWLAYLPDADPSARPESVTERKGRVPRRVTSFSSMRADVPS
jgi:hypothetical protein